MHSGPKHYVWSNDSYYAGNGCSCCEADYMECYNNDSPEFCGMGSAHSITTLKEYMIVGNKIFSEERLDEVGEYMEYLDYEKFLDRVLSDHAITYEIVAN